MFIGRRRHALGVLFAVATTCGNIAFADKVFWTQITGDYRCVFSADLDGRNQTVVHQTPLYNYPVRVTADLPGRKIYFSVAAGRGGPTRVQRADLGGSNVEVLYVPSDPDDDISGVAVHHSHDEVYWLERFMGVRRLSFDPPSVVTVVNYSGSSQSAAEDLEVDPLHGFLFWNDPYGDSIYRSKLDGSDFRTVFQGNSITIVGLAVDPTRAQLYWSGIVRGGGGGIIQRADLDGNSVETSAISSDLPADLAVHPSTKQIYWTESIASTVQRANFDGGELQIIATFPSLSFPYGIALFVSCGDGTVETEEGEICDIAIPSGGPGSCPTNCDDSDPCTIDTLVDAGACSAHCEHNAITAFLNGDGCCPSSGGFQGDSDCAFQAIPTVSQWGLVISGIALLLLAKLRFRAVRAE